MLFATNASGSVVAVNAGTEEFYTPGSTHVTVLDRDSAGNAIRDSVNGTATAFSVDYTLLGQKQGPAYSEFIAFGYPKSDGLFLGQNATSSGTYGQPLPQSPIEVSGGRAYDGQFGSWTTPDAYKGKISDPASMGRYMWNSNNLVAYADPSGFDPNEDEDPEQNRNGMAGSGEEEIPRIGAPKSELRPLTNREKVRLSSGVYRACKRARKQASCSFED